MDSRRERITIIPFFILVLVTPSLVSSTGVFKVHHKFSRQEKSLSAIKDHDSNRHRRILAAIDLPLGGDGNPSGTGLYYAKISLGTPPKDFEVQVDTGSDILWVNCIQCTTCEAQNKASGNKFVLYNPKESVSGKLVTCDDDFCDSMYPMYEGNYPGCAPNKLCEYRVRYADGSQTDGYYVKDYLSYNQASGNEVTSPGNASIVFGCGARQSGVGYNSQGVDGLMGFGASNTSVLSQLASSGKVKKVFSHCLDGNNGGGIFAIGRIVEPKVKSTPLVPDMPHYNVKLKEIEVGKTVLDLPTDIFETGESKGTIIDSGTTLAYLPDDAYTPLMQTILSHQPDLKIRIISQIYQCFQFTGSLDDVFPTVTFHFEGSLSLTVYPHDYMFKTQDKDDLNPLTCIGWQNSGLQSKEGRDITLLGDMVLSNKLVVYDLEKEVIGWTEYNCSSSIKLVDDHSGTTYSVGSHDLSSACVVDIGKILIMLLLSTALLHFIFF